MRSFTNTIPFFIFWFFTTTSADTLTGTQTLRTNETLLSSNQTYVLGFFTGSNSNLYLGIWYRNTTERTIVWVANRDNPLNNSGGFLKFGDSGNIVLVNSSENTIWSSNQTSAKNPVLQLLDSGNLVIIEANSDPTKYLWQGFDHPSDTLLPGMKVGQDLDTGIEMHLTSWKVTGKDPSTGDYFTKLDYHGLPEMFILNNNQTVFRTGPWNGEGFSGMPEMHADTDSIEFSFIADADEVYYSYTVGNNSLISRLLLTSDGKLQRFTMLEGTQAWSMFWYVPRDQCDEYKECGPNGICDNNASPVCKCMRGFSPKNQQAWDLRDGSDGCVRNTGLDCGNDKFWKVQYVKLPQTGTAFLNRSMTLLECEALCQRNCSCTAYANADIRNGGSGCVMWITELIDMRQYSEGIGGQDLYVRLAASDVGGSSETNNIAEIVGITVSAIVVLLGLLGIYLIRRKRKLQSILNVNTQQIGSFHRNQDQVTDEVVFSSNMDDLELPMFDFDTLTMATNNFSEANKIGEGGFGSVYKVWKQWREGTTLELIDSSIGDTYSISEGLRCIHIGLLCVQERAEDRPTMSSVVMMLNSESISMAEPKSPGFSIGKNHVETDSSSSKKDETWSVNQVTVTLLDAR
ncbi:unnamed protein product [Lupinus luteus]|uniref:non-specific serine/threonine protein kinase n=1 Tax=Lupinus luteus TaxID=3873 RepID=A0AAV1WJ96_LUPLU